MSQKQTVYLAGSRQGNKEKNYSDNKYHTESTCPYLKRADAYREVELQQVPTYEKCRYCAGDIVKDTPQETKTCNLCGEEFKELPDHIVSCPER